MPSCYGFSAVLPRRRGSATCRSNSATKPSIAARKAKRQRKARSK